MSNTFNLLGLPEPLVRKLTDLGFTEPFPIQQSAVPPALSGRDVQGRAPTGSGKTLAFGLPVLARVDRGERNRPNALVLAPTRELAEQIRSDLEPLATAVYRRVAAVYGGVGYGPQLSALRRGVDVLVATPGRLLDLIQRRAVDLARVDIVVVDEADRMADMGFLPDVRRILDQTDGRRQTYLFSATLDGEIGVLSKAYQRDPVQIRAEARHEKQIDLKHHFWRVARADRVSHTARLVRASGRSIVFTRTRHGADRLVKQLARADVSAVAMHGGRSQSQRTRALSAFASGRAMALVATDVAARGIHVEDVAAVVHFDIAGDHKDYVHRSGRTARAGAAGNVITLVTEGEERAIRRLLSDLNIAAAIEAPDIEGFRRDDPRDGGRAVSPHPAVGEGSGDTGKSRSPVAPRRSLFVGNLPWRITGRELEQLFSDHGTVERATISTHKKTGRSKGFGFVDIVEHRPNGAVDALNGAMVGGRPVHIRPAR